MKGNNRYKILVIEDDRSICSFLETELQTAGYQVLTAGKCGEGILLFFSHIPDLVILDLGLPDMDGEEFIRQVREKSTVPILVLSARTEESDKVSALDFGANDFITKPFGTLELVARIRAAIRSAQHTDMGSLLPGGIFTAGDLQIDYGKREITVAGEIIHFTQTEYNILAFLSKHTGKVLTYSAIIREIWGAMDEGGIKKLQVNMANIRRKMGVTPGCNKYIKNELGVGYRMLDDNV